MNAAPIVDAHQTDEIREGPGSRLRQARLSKGLEMSRVAAQLHLSDAMVEALEKDDYDSLPSPVFVRGYLKNYTRLLGIDSQSVLDDFERLVPADGDGTPLVQSPTINADVESSHPLVRILTWLMGILLIGLVVVWWQGRLSWPLLDEGPGQTGTAEVVSPAEPTTGAPEESQASTLDSARDDELQAMEPQERRSTGSQPAEAPASRAPLTAREPAMDETPPELREVPTSEAEPAAVDNRASVDQPSGGAEPALFSPDQPSPDEPQAPVRRANIAFSFADSSWVDIRDASGKKTITGVIEQGTRRELIGEPPFSVVLGKARVVDVWVNGEPYDISRHIRGDVARFEIDPDNP